MNRPGTIDHTVSVSLPESNPNREDDAEDDAEASEMDHATVVAMISVGAENTHDVTSIN